jgi:hypothetical protein
VRTERPSEQPRPLSTPAPGNPGAERPAARPQQPVSPPEAVSHPQMPRPDARPQQPVSPPEAVSHPQMPRPDARPQQPLVAPRVAEPVRPEEQTAPRPPQGEANQSDNNRFSQGWSHPQAKPAPPVQQRNAAQAQDDENKFRTWQQQRPQAAPAQNRAPQEKPQAPHQAPREQDKKPKSQG